MISGFFDGLPQLGTFDVMCDGDTVTFQIDYGGGNGNDVDITVTNVTTSLTTTNNSGVSSTAALASSDSSDVQVGTDGNDILSGGDGDDLLTGGPGDDTFIFRDGEGDDTIDGFAAGLGVEDVIDLSGVSALGDFAAVQTAASQVGGDTVIDLDSENSVTLVGVDPIDLDQDDFLF